jgi:hypothetical protein
MFARINGSANAGQFDPRYDGYYLIREYPSLMGLQLVS